MMAIHPNLAAPEVPVGCDNATAESPVHEACRTSARTRQRGQRAPIDALLRLKAWRLTV